MSFSLDAIDGVPFTFFVSLVREISRIPPRPVAKSKRTNDHPARQVFSRWVVTLRERFPSAPPDTFSTILRLLFPNEDKQRVYNFRETQFAKYLSDCLGFPAKKLEGWQSEGGSGCLGRELQIILEKSHSDPGAKGPFSIAEIDDILNELAASSPYTDDSIRTKYPRNLRRKRTDILSLLFRQLPPADAACVVQIILKDLRPLLYPQNDVHYTTAFKKYNAKARRMLERTDAMYVWDPSGKLYRASKVAGILHQSASLYEMGEGVIVPQIGTFIEVPKSERGQSCRKALNILRQSNSIYAETKYDGERTQIHVRVSANSQPAITIFSKSTRNSTADRAAIHPIVLEALGLNNGDVPQIQENVILDAEMVAYHGDHIDDFWRIRGLIEETADGVRGTRRISSAYKRSKADDDEETQASLASTISDDRHLALVFFDILYLNSESLLTTPYSERRALLEKVIKPVPHYAFLATRTLIDLKSNDSPTSIYQVFGKAISNYEEGLVLKAAESMYNEKSLPWVKLKRDYIPGLGDALDMVVVAAGWDQRRAHELQVPVGTLTTFYIGIIENSEDVKRSDQVIPLFHIFFKSSYGLNREQLEELNFFIKSHEPMTYDKSKPVAHALSVSLNSQIVVQPTEGLSYNYNLLPGLPPPDVLLPIPILCEVFGDRFTKAPRSKYYELRFPRITKIYRWKERTWEDGVTPEMLKQTAHEVLGIDRKNKDIDDYCHSLWNVASSPGVRSGIKRKRRESEWVDQLRAADHLPPLHLSIQDSSSPIQSTASPQTTVKRLFALPNLNISEDILMPHSPLTSRTNLPLPSSPLRYSTEDFVGHLKSPTSSPITLSPSLVKTPYSAKRRRLTLPHHQANYSTLPISPRITTTPTRLPYAMPTPVTSPAISSPVRSRTNCYDDSTPFESFKAFLLASVIWISDSSQRSSQQHPIIPVDNLLHSLDSLLLGCGWPKDCTLGPFGGCTWATQGVILVQDLLSLNVVKQEILRRKEAIKRAPPGKSRLTDSAIMHGRKPVWVFDHQILNLHTEDWKQFVLWHSN